MKRTITIGGQPYTLTAPSARDVQTLLDEAKRALPDPVREVLDTAALIPEGATRDKFLADNLQPAFEEKKRRGTLTDPAANAWIATVDGALKLCGIMFRKAHPHLTDDQIGQLVDQATAEHGADIFKDIFDKSTHAPMSEREVEDSFSRPSA